MSELDFTMPEKIALWFVILVFLPVGLAINFWAWVVKLVKAGDMPHDKNYNRK